MVAEIITSIGLFKSILDTAKALKDINDAAARNALAIELQEKILAAQEQQSSLVEAVRQLEEKVRSFETWEAEKKRYELKELPPGKFTRALKPEMANGEPIHYICERCYEDGKKSILAKSATTAGTYHLKCHRCETDLIIGTPEPLNRTGGAFGRGGPNSWMGS